MPEPAKTRRRIDAAIVVARAGIMALETAHRQAGHSIISADIARAKTHLGNVIQRIDALTADSVPGA